jgi:DNA-binding beta-propeller fold protein YncE
MCYKGGKHVGVPWSEDGADRKRWNMSSTFEPGALLLVSSSTAKNLDFFDLSTGEKIATIDDLIAEPHEIAFDSSRRRAYVAHTYRYGVYDQQDVPKSHEISVIDVDGRRVESVIDTFPYFAPHDIEYDTELDLIITGVENFDGHKGVVLINAETHKVEESIETEARNVHWLALIPGRKVFATHKEAPIITVIDLKSRRVEATISVPGGAEEIDASPEGDFVYAVTPRMRVDVDLGGSGHFFRPERKEGDPIPRVVKIDALTNLIVDEIEFDDYQMGLFAGYGQRIYSTGMNNLERPTDESVDLRLIPRPNGKLHIIDGADMTLLGAADVGPLPLTVRSAKDNSIAWVANLGSGLVTVIDVDTRSHVGDLDNNGGGAYGGTHGMALIPAG